MFLRALSAYLVLPGIVAGLIPALIARADAHGKGSFAVGLVLMGGAFVLHLSCVVDFLKSGRGTLAPWDPPKKLVVVGLYRYVRNPMYIAVVTFVAGWAVATGSIWLLIYALAWSVIFHLRVISHEEHALETHFPKEWRAYSDAVPRWIPRFTPWNSHASY